MTDFKKALQNASKDGRFPVMQLTREDPQLAVLMSKAIKGTLQANYDESGNIAPQTPNVSAFRNVGMRRAQDNADNKTVMQVLTDIKRTKQILVSSILAPKDMVTVEMNYTSLNGLLPPEVSSEMMDVVKTQLDQDYKITPKLPDIFGNALFDDGSYTIAVIPENTLDKVINSHKSVALEDLKDSFDSSGRIRNIGILGPAVKEVPVAKTTANIARESFGDFTPDLNFSNELTLAQSFGGKPQETFITITDNPAILKLPRLQQKVREQRIMGSIFGSQAAMESMHNVRPLNDHQLMNTIYKNRQFKYNPVASLKTQDQLNRLSAGEPTVLWIPSEAFVPLFTPGDVKQQIGGFAILDGEGHFVTRTTYKDMNIDIGARLQANSSFPSSMMNKIKGEMNGFDAYNQQHLDYSTRVFADMVEQEMLARMRNGQLGKGVQIARSEAWVKIMFARALAQQHTQLLFLPVELFTYIAFDYDDNGIGKSILDDQKVLNSLRMAVKFANVTAGVKNAIGRTQVNIKLDERDPDPFRTEEIIKHEVVRSRQKALPPTGMVSPTDIVDHLNLASMDFTTEGHPAMPDIKIDFSEKNSNYVRPDTELDDGLRKDGIMGAGVPPELVDSGIPVEFATTVVSSNILLAKTVISLQDAGTPQITDSIRKYMTFSPKLQKSLMDVLERNKDKLKTRIDDYIKDKEIIEGQEKNIERFVLECLRSEFIANFEAHLPRPNSVTLENQLAALEVYEKGLDKVLDQLISSTFFTSDTGGDVANQADALKALAKAQFMRRYISENGILPELSELTATKEDGTPMLPIYQQMADHVTALMKSFTGFDLKIKPIKDAANVVMQQAIGGAEGGGGDTSTTSDDTGGGGGSDDLNFNTDEFGGGGGGLNDNDGSDTANAGGSANEPAAPAEGEDNKPPEGGEGEPEAT